MPVEAMYEELTKEATQVNSLVIASLDNPYGDEAMELASKLQGEIQIEDFIWRNRQTSLGSMNFYFNNVLCDSWALCVNLPDKNKYFSIISYTASESKEIFKQMMLSILDSLCVDRGSFFEAGAITTFAFPKSETEIHEFNFEGKTFQVNFDKSDAAANNYLVEREYQILELYSQTDFWLLTLQDKLEPNLVVSESWNMPLKNSLL